MRVSSPHFTRKAYCLIPLVLALALLLAVPAQAEDTVLENTLTDHLSSGEEAKWYSFVLEEPGDAVLFAAGQQEVWDGYAYHWRCTVYGEDRETELGAADVRGYTVDYGPSVIALPGLEAGTYYVRLTSASATNPLLATSTEAPYELRLVRYGRSQVPVYSGDSFQTFQRAGDVVWSCNGSAFLKQNDGECFAGLMKTRDGMIVPILISTEAEAVEYLFSGTGELVPAAGPLHHKDSGIDYYYSDSEGVGRYTDSPPKTSSLPILYADTNSAKSAAEEVADKQLEAELGKRAYWWLTHKETLGTIGAIIGGLFLLAILGGPGGSGGKDDDIDETPLGALISEYYKDM